MRLDRDRHGAKRSLGCDRYYVHVASAHHRDLPECIQVAAHGIGDPDRRVLAMLGSRGRYVAAAAEEIREVRESA
jgi:hypothetical protein